MTQPDPSSTLIKIMERIAYKAIEETIGRNDLQQAMDMGRLNSVVDHKPEQDTEPSIQLTEFSDLQASLEKLYGLRGSQGLVLRSGRACFKYGLREFGTQLGLDATSFRLLPLNAKISIATHQFADFLNGSHPRRVNVEENSSSFLFRIDDCPICRGRHSDVPVCHLAVGVLEEALYWISGGKHFHVEETNCIAKGDQECTLVIQKQPLE